MKIIKDRENSFYSERNRLVGNAFTIIDDNNKEHYYEFNLRGDEAIIKFSDLDYIEVAVKAFRKYNKYIYKFSTNDKSFYEELDRVFTFKLPIKCIQPSEFFIDKERLEVIENNLDDDNIYIPVAIINDEYVALDGHTRLYAMNQNYSRLVNVYIDSYSEDILDFIYIAKEHNITTIAQMPVLPHDEYEEVWGGFLKDYYNNK